MTARIRHVETLAFYDTILIFEGATDAGSPVIAVLTAHERDGWDVYCAAILDAATMAELKANRLPLRDALTTRRHGSLLYGTIDRDPAFFRCGPDLPEEDLPVPGIPLNPPAGDEDEN